MKINKLSFEKAKIGKIYRSRINQIAFTGYLLIRKYKTTCWVKAIDFKTKKAKGPIYKGVPYNTFWEDTNLVMK